MAVGGGKNAAVAIIPAALLADSPSVIENLPDIEDVHVLIQMLRWLGAEVEFIGGVMTIDPRGVDKSNPPYELASKMRASYYLSPVLLGVFGHSAVPMPGGCDIGARPIDQTIKGMTTLGAKVDTKNIGVIITDHNVDETLAITDRTYLLYEGKILKTGTAEELAADPMVRKVYLGQHFELKKSHQLTQQMKNRKGQQAQQAGEETETQE